jgi:hypothetical protein
MSFKEILAENQKWKESGDRLLAIIKEVGDKIGEPPLCIMEEDGEYYLHPLLSSILHEPGNEGPLEFLRYCHRNGLGTEGD